MRIPSRLMPRVARKPTSLGALGILAVLLASFAYLLWQHPIPVLCFVAFFGAISVIETKRAKAHLSKLAAQRTGESICTFAREASCRANDTWVVRAVYEQVQSYLGSEFQSFPLRWNDSFEKDLKIDIEDVEAVIASEVAERTRRNFSETTGNPMYAKVSTVGDLVLFFCAQPIENGRA
ncbi:MAG: hypothetical protein ACXW1O_06505 [Halobacteriota archaeon]